MLNEERTKVNELSSWKNFALQVENHKNEMKKIISSLSGKKIIGFGSSARSQTFLNFCNLNENNINYIIDNNSMKQNLYSPGTNIKIVDFEYGIKSNPEIIFLIAWNFKDEIIKQCKEAGYKGKFIVPFPSNPKIL